MADILLAQAGDLLDSANWTGGVVPGPSDRAILNNFIGTLAGAWEVQEITNSNVGGGSAGGSVTLLDGAAFTGGMTGRNGVFNFSAAGSASLSFRTKYENVANGAQTIVHSGTGTLTIDSDVELSTGFTSCRVISHTGTGVTQFIDCEITTAGINPIAHSAGTMIFQGGELSAGTANAYVASGVPTLVLGCRLRTSADGVFPISPGSAKVFLLPVFQSELQMRSYGTPPLTDRSLYTASPAIGFPLARDIRAGTIAGPDGEITGTLAVAPAGSVAFGVPTDDTVGEAVITQQQLQDAIDGIELPEGIATATNVDDAEAAILAAILNTVPLDPPTFTRSTADEKPIQFSWINGTDTLTATRSIDGGAFEAVAGAIAFFRNENSVAQYTLAYNAADRPTEEGTVRYKVTNGAITVVLTLRVEEPGGGAATIGDWAITRTFQVAGGDKVSGVRLSLVGVAGKTDTTGSDGIATVKTDDGTYTLRVVVPAGYEDVADTSVTINGADDTATVTLVATVTPPPSIDLATLTVSVTSQDGTPLEGIAVEAKIPPGENVSQGAMALNVVLPASTNSNGVATLTLYREQDYELWFTREKGSRTKIRIRTTASPTQTLSQVFQG